MVAQQRVRADGGANIVTRYTAIWHNGRDIMKREEERRPAPPPWPPEERPGPSIAFWVGVINAFLVTIAIGGLLYVVLWR